MSRAWTRPQWGAGFDVPAGGWDLRPVAGITDLFLHYSAAEASPGDCAAQVRAIERYHIEERGFRAIAYSALVCLAHGDIFEGRPLNAVGGHTLGFNTTGYGLCVLTDDDTGTELTLEARKRIRNRFANVTRKVVAAGGKPPARKGHRDVGSTTCPGDELYAWLKAGMPL